MDSPQEPSSPRRGAPTMPSRVRGPVKLEDKMQRTSYSCAECKRLKLKCSRTPWPCTSCERRGCGSICPDGEMRAYKKGKYMIMAGTEDLHNRVEALENALRAAHAKNSKEPHPLLKETHFYTSSRSGKKEEQLVENAFGLLKIGSEGEARYVGPAAGSEYLQEAGVELEDYDGDSTPAPEERDPRGAYAEDAIRLMDAYLTAGPPYPYTAEQLQEQLPDWDKYGKFAMESYWENVNWMYQVIPRSMFERDHYENAYISRRPHPHKLACVFFMLALGYKFDLTRKPWDPEARRQFLHGRFALSLVGLEHATPATVQAIHLMGTFILNDGLDNGAHIFWPILGTATRVAQGLGLHRDGKTFGLSDYEVTERRQVYWEILTYDRLQALCFGRPCAFQNRSSDTKFPVENEWIEDKDGFHLAKYKLMGMMESVIEIQTSAAPVSYNTVVELDRKLVEFRNNLPEQLLSKVMIPDLPLDRNSSPQFVIHRFGIRLLVAQTRLLLNRHWIMRAIQLNPQNPYNTIVAEAFIATYESAQEVVQIVKQLVLYHPALIARWWFFWFHAISAAVVLGAVTILAPSSPFASPAYTGMTHVVTICEAAGKGFRAKSALPFIQRLRDRAGAALARAAQQNNTLAGEPDTGLSHLDSTPKLVRVGSEPPRLKAEQSPIDSSMHAQADYPVLSQGYMRWENANAASPAASAAGTSAAAGGSSVVDALLEQQQQQQHFPSDGYDAPTMNYAENWFNPLPWQAGSGSAAAGASTPSGSAGNSHHAHHAHHDSPVDFQRSGSHHSQSQSQNQGQSQGGQGHGSNPVPPLVFEERLAMDSDLTVAMGLESMEGNADGGLYFNQFVNNLAAAGHRPGGI